MSDHTEKQPGLVVTQGRIALILSVIALLTVFYQGASLLLSSQYRIDSLEKNQNVMVQQLERLNTTITDLNMTLREVQIRQETK